MTAARSELACAQAAAAATLVLGGTDSRWFRPLTENVYRFAPLQYTPEVISTLHGTNERIGIGVYLDCVRFYRRLLENTAS